MATFTSFNDRLPDPTFGVSIAGSVDAAGVKGPGFASERVASNTDVQVSRTVSGRGVHREQASQFWDITINYNPMLREQFDTVSAFLEGRNGRLHPFFVVLPDRARPRDSSFATFATNNVISAAGAHAEGSTTMLIDAVPAFSGTPLPGDFFNIVDPADVNHLKTYKVTRVETNTLYQSGQTQPATNQVRIHFTPSLTRFVSDNAVIRWINPQFRVYQKGNVLEYDLNTDNLFQFQLQLEEILP